MSISTPNAISTPNTSPTITTDALTNRIRQGRQNLWLPSSVQPAARSSSPRQAPTCTAAPASISDACHCAKSLILSAEQARRDGANSTPETREAAFEAAIKEKRRVTSMLRDKNYHKLADQDNITVITGRAHFTGPHSVEIATAGARSP